MVFKKSEILGFFFLFIGPLFSMAQTLQFQEKPDGILLLERGTPRYFYRTSPVDTYSSFARTNYVHPLYGLDGEILTEDFPEDHPHHHGIFWSWHQLYAEGKRIGDPWLNLGVEWQVVNTKTEVKGNQAILRSEILWINKETSERVIRENLEITFNRLGDDVFKVEFNIDLTALQDGVAIGGSEDAKAYGGFSARLKLPEDVSFHSCKGKVEPANLAISAGPWINISGSFNSMENQSSGVIIMGEPENLPGYEGWILRPAKSMQNMAFPGKIPFIIENGESLTFRNQLLVHRDLDLNEIREFYREFRE